MFLPVTVVQSDPHLKQAIPTSLWVVIVYRVQRCFLAVLSSRLLRVATVAQALSGCHVVPTAAVLAMIRAMHDGGDVVSVCLRFL